MRETAAAPHLATACYLHAQASGPEFQNVQLSISLGETHSSATLEASWNQVWQARSILRAGFAKSSRGETVRRESESMDLNWSTQDWTELPLGEIPGHWQEVLKEDSARAFDPATPPLLRFQAFALPGGHCQLLLSFPRLLLDEDSLFHILCEWLEALNGMPPSDEAEPTNPSPPAPAVAEWWNRFHARNSNSQPFAIYPQPEPSAAPRRIKTPETLLDRDTSRNLKAFGQRIGVPTQDVFLAVWALVLSRLSASENASLLASPSQSSAPNFLPCSPPLDSSLSLEAWLQAVAKSETERAENAAIGLERCLVLADPPMDLTSFSSAFFWAPPPLNDRLHDAFPRWINADFQLSTRSQFPLSLLVRDGNRFSLQIEADPSLCPPGEAANLQSRVIRIIELLTTEPSRKLGSLPLLSAAEQEATAVKGKKLPEPTKTLDEALSGALSRHPDSAAIIGPEKDSELSYEDLDSHASALAHWLHAESVANGWNVAVCLTPTTWLPVALLGILRAGDTCVPLDPSASPDWLASHIEQSDVELIICDSGTAASFDSSAHRLLILDQEWEKVSAASALGNFKPAADAFLLNGTETDPPPQLRTLSAKFLLATSREAGALWSLEAGDRVGLYATAGTAAFVEVLLVSLLSGATVVLPPSANPFAFEKFETPGPTHLRLTVDQWRVLASRLPEDSPVLPETVKCLCLEVTGPVPVASSLWQSLQESSALKILFFSPAGLSGAGLLSSIAGDGSDPVNLPIGRPSTGVHASLRDPAGQLLPPHYPGRLEICLQSQGPETFSVPAWQDQAGVYHFLPSKSFATAKALLALPEIFDLYCSDSPTQVWAVLVPGAETPAPHVTQAATQHLPPKLRPDFFQVVDSFPLSSGGHIDAASLPRPSSTSSQPPEVPTTPEATAAPTPRSGTPIQDWDPLVCLHTTPDAPVLFLVHDLDGTTSPYGSLAELLKSDWTIYGTTARGLKNPSACHLTVESEAAALVESLCLLDPEGPFHLAGHGFGAILAMEMARQFRIAGRSVPYLVLTGSTPPESNSAGSWHRALTRMFSRAPATPSSHHPNTPVARAHLEALKNHRSEPLPGPVGIILGSDMGKDVESAWQLAAPESSCRQISAPSSQFLQEPPVKRLAVLMREWMVPEGEESSD